MKRFAKLTHDHSGWTSEEDVTLFNEVKKMRGEGRPLKAAFDNVAELTGRRSNSVRNYYYMRIRDDDYIKRFDPEKAVNFVPFTKDETDELLERLLTDQARGISVRASTMALSDGDMTAMLRFQNKYRALLKSDPETVKAKVKELREEGKAAFDPYNDTPVHRSGRPKKSAVPNDELMDAMAETVKRLYDVEGLDVTALFESIGALARSAGDGAEAIRKLSEIEAGIDRDFIMLREENNELRERVAAMEAEISDKNSEILALTSSISGLFASGGAFAGAAGQ